jgi:hypothetical protein
MIQLANKIVGAQGNRCHTAVVYKAKDKVGDLQSFLWRKRTKDELVQQSDLVHGRRL